MSAWFARNAAPIGLVVVASVGGDLTGITSFGGLVKVAAFFAVGSLIARPLRSRFNEYRKS